MTARSEGWGRAPRALAMLAVAILLAVVSLSAVRAEDRLQIFVTSEAGFGRLVLKFPNRLDLPNYRISYENNVLAIAFDEEIAAVVPDIAVTLPDYVTIARVDPDRKGIRFGLRAALKINHLEAGEQLFVDLMPPDWQGLPPGLPPSVVAMLSQRAEDAARLAEQRQKAADALVLKPAATVRVGRNPTFVRVQIDWNVRAKGSFAVEGDTANLDFDWPVPIDLYALEADLPPELLAVENSVSPDGSRIVFTAAEGVVPRFYAVSDTQFIVDVDIVSGEPIGQIVLDEEMVAEAEVAEEATAALPQPQSPQAEIVPYVTTMGDTVRLVFPFEADVAAAVFRRGDSLWMLFDTAATIAEPNNLAPLTQAAGSFSVLRAGDTQVVRLDLTTERLATLGTEGRWWVLSLGDVLLSPTEAIPLNRRRDEASQFEMTADLSHPGLVHQFRDPVAGDLLTVVTAFAPARGVVRPLDFVDFTALATVHGLVIKGKSDALGVSVEGALAVIHGPDGVGLALSSADQARGMVVGLDAKKRMGFINLIALDEDDPALYREEEDTLLGLAAAAELEAKARDAARLKLAEFYVANRFGHEAIGVLSVLGEDLEAEIAQRARLTRAIADIVSYRPREAIEILSGPTFLEDPDAVMWRAIARAEAGDYREARLDAMASEVVLDSYPQWVREAFLLGAARAAVETSDVHLARHYLGQLDAATLEPEQASYHSLFAARIAEAENRIDEALDGYGQVIAADVRPTRAEAVYRTLLLLDRKGGLDLEKASGTLSAEAMLWRGDGLEAQMQRLLADLYFRHGDYRLGFETVKQAVQFAPDTPDSEAMTDEAQATFVELYLNGLADRMAPIDALTLFYDFRSLTPPGVRGDEMIRNLARRLVQVDLLQQAGDLLEYQIDSRLDGAAKAQIAAELAVIRLADRDPESALRALNRTRLADLSPQLERQRRVLEAKALIDAGRQDLAIDLISSLTGRDADLLRIEGLWKGQHYGAAAELIEASYSTAGDAEMTAQPARMNIIKAAVGFVLADDKVGLSRLKSKFGERMALSPEWPMFDFVTSTVGTGGIQFRQVAREVSGLDGLNAFLASYRETYGGDLAPAEAAPADGA